VLGPPLPTGTLPWAQSVASLFACIGLGVPLYVATSTGLWFLAGRPEESAESHVLRRVPLVWSYALAKLGR
jgi:hypothetical protein